MDCVTGEFFSWTFWNTFDDAYGKRDEREIEKRLSLQRERREGCDILLRRAWELLEFLTAVVAAADVVVVSSTPMIRSRRGEEKEKATCHPLNSIGYSMSVYQQKCSRLGGLFMPLT